MTNEKLIEIAKKEISYNRHLALVGKEKADMVLYFWMEGYNYAKGLILNRIEDTFLAS